MIWTLYIENTTKNIKQQKQVEEKNIYEIKTKKNTKKSKRHIMKKQKKNMNINKKKLAQSNMKVEKNEIY